MKKLSEMLQEGCHFCKKALTGETALCGTMSISLAGTNVWSDPVPILFCAQCKEREQKA
jgi:hypothetical protein